MKHFSRIIFVLLFSFPAFAGDRVVINPDSGGDLKLKVNIGGTATDALTVAGSNGTVVVGPVNNQSLSHVIWGGKLGVGTTPASVSGFGSVLHIKGTADSSLRLDNGTNSWEIGNNNSQTLQFYANSTIAGSVSSGGAWTLGLTSGGATTGLTVKATGSSTAVIDRTVSAGALSGIEFQGGGVKNSRFMTSSTNAFSIENSSGADVGSATQAGSWTIGISGQIQILNGLTRFEEAYGWSFGSQRPGMFYTATASPSTCTAQCDTDKSSHGFGATGSGTCIAAWTSGNAVSTCGTSLTSGKCLCAAID